MTTKSTKPVTTNVGNTRPFKLMWRGHHVCLSFSFLSYPILSYHTSERSAGRSKKLSRSSHLSTACTARHSVSTHKTQPPFQHRKHPAANHNIWRMWQCVPKSAPFEALHVSPFLHAPAASSATALNPNPYAERHTTRHRRSGPSARFGGGCFQTSLNAWRSGRWRWCVPQRWLLTRKKGKWNWWCTLICACWSLIRSTVVWNEVVRDFFFYKFCVNVYKWILNRVIRGIPVKILTRIAWGILAEITDGIQSGFF